MKTKQNNLGMVYDADAKKVVKWFPQEDLASEFSEAKKHCHKVVRDGKDIVMYGFQNSKLTDNGRT